MQEGAVRAAGPGMALLSIFGYFDIGKGLVYSTRALGRMLARESKNGIFATHNETSEFERMSIEQAPAPKEEETEE